MGVLTASEENRRLDLVTLAQEALDVLLLELVIVFVDLRPELDLLDLDHPLMFLRGPRPLLLLVLVLAEVHDSADRRNRRRRNLYEIEYFRLVEHECLWRRHDAELLAGLVDNADLTNPNALIGTNTIVTSWATVESDRNLRYSAAPFRATSAWAAARNSSTGLAP